jgi:hypothetical protein
MLAIGVVVLVRTFQRHVGHARFDNDRFRRFVEEPIREILSSGHVRRVVVAIPDLDSGYSEVPHRGVLPSETAIGNAFSREIGDGRVLSLRVSHWGANPGSATALNVGLAHAREVGAPLFLAWSPEFSIKSKDLDYAVKIIETAGHDVVGYYRAGYEGHRPYLIPQNTCALWQVESLSAVNGFDSLCEGDGLSIVAGMEDFDLLLRLVRLRRVPASIGMLGASSPYHVDTSFKRTGTQELHDHLRKVERQDQVMLAYAERHFPGEDPSLTIARLVEGIIRY